MELETQHAGRRRIGVCCRLGYNYGIINGGVHSRIRFLASLVILNKPKPKNKQLPESMRTLSIPSKRGLTVSSQKNRGGWGLSSNPSQKHPRSFPSLRTRYRCEQNATIIPHAQREISQLTYPEKPGWNTVQKQREFRGEFSVLGRSPQRDNTRVV